MQGETSRSWSSKRSSADGKWTSVSGSTSEIETSSEGMAVGAGITCRHTEQERPWPKKSTGLLYPLHI